jgi:predicted metalloprotease with PDZ domain
LAFAAPLVPLWLLCVFPAWATIRYDVALARPGQHEFRIGMNIPEVRGEVTIQMASWDGLYQIRDFAHHVTGMRAADLAGKDLPIERIDKQTWQIRGSGEVRVEYATLWDEAGPFGTQLDAEHAFVNLAMVLCYVPARLSEDTVVHFTNLPQGWRVAVQLPKFGGASDVAPAFAASDYNVLVDAPVEIGRFEEVQFRAGGRPIRVVIHGDPVDRTRLTAALASIVDYQTRMMGGAPFDEYLFILHAGRRFGGGGMEHSNSTAIAAGSLPGLISVGAHEFFHLWNVKRIRPQSLEPVDRTQEMWTRALWFAEGVTSTYGSYTLVRTGLWSKADFLEDIGEQITILQNRPARLWQSAEESSLTTWFDKYPLYDRSDFSISYYNKGQLLGVGLDLVIRDATDNRASLDDVLRKLNDDYARRGRYYDDSAGIQAAVEQVVRQARPESTTDFAEFFRRYVAGTDELPFGEWLGIAGLTLKVTGERHQVEQMPQATERRLRILNGLLTGTVTANAMPATVGAGGR